MACLDYAFVTTLQGTNTSKPLLQFHIRLLPGPKLLLQQGAAILVDADMEGSSSLRPSDNSTSAGTLSS